MIETKPSVRQPYTWKAFVILHLVTHRRSLLLYIEHNNLYRINEVLIGKPLSEWLQCFLESIEYFFEQIKYVDWVKAVLVDNVVWVMAQSQTYRVKMPYIEYNFIRVTHIKDTFCLVHRVPPRPGLGLIDRVNLQTGHKIFIDLGCISNKRWVRGYPQRNRQLTCSIFRNVQRGLPLVDLRT